MKQPDDSARVRHMLESSLEAIEFLGDTSFENFRKNRIVANAIVRSLEVIGEAANQVTQEFKDDHRDIEWHVIIGMRNRLIHAYFDIDYLVVWQTVRENLPPFINQLKKILKDSET